MVITSKSNIIKLCFPDQACAVQFKQKFDSLHPSLKFTYGFESNAPLPFLDVFVERVSDHCQHLLVCVFNRIRSVLSSIQLALFAV